MPHPRGAGSRDALSQAYDKAATLFVGRLPRGVPSEELAAVLAAVGPLRQVIPSRETYLFCEYADGNASGLAASVLNGKYVNGSRIVVVPAVTLRKLFIGNVDRLVPPAEIHAAIASIEPGLLTVEVFEETLANSGGVGRGRGSGAISGGGLGRSTVYGGGSVGGAPAFTHRGFCFAEFASHDAAHRALWALADLSFALPVPSASPPGGPLLQRGVKVDWAEPPHEVEDDVMATVRVLYVSNLPPAVGDAPEALLCRLFEQYGPLERVKRLKNFAFVHYETRADAAAALAGAQGTVLGGHAIRVQWSKPPPSALTPLPTQHIIVPALPMHPASASSAVGGGGAGLLTPHPMMPGGRGGGGGGVGGATPLPYPMPPPREGGPIDYRHHHHAATAAATSAAYGGPYPGAGAAAAPPSYYFGGGGGGGRGGGGGGSRRGRGGGGGGGGEWGYGRGGGGGDEGWVQSAPPPQWPHGGGGGGYDSPGQFHGGGAAYGGGGGGYGGGGWAAAAPVHEEGWGAASLQQQQQLGRHGGLPHQQQQPQPMSVDAMSQWLAVLSASQQGMPQLPQQQQQHQQLRGGPPLYAGGGGGGEAWQLGGLADALPALPAAAAAGASQGLLPVPPGYPLQYPHHHPAAAGPQYPLYVAGPQYPQPQPHPAAGPQYPQYSAAGPHTPAAPLYWQPAPPPFHSPPAMHRLHHHPADQQQQQQYQPGGGSGAEGDPSSVPALLPPYPPPGAGVAPAMAYAVVSGSGGSPARPGTPRSEGAGGGGGGGGSAASGPSTEGGAPGGGGAWPQPMRGYSHSDAPIPLAAVGRRDAGGRSASLPLPVPRSPGDAQSEPVLQIAAVETATAADAGGIASSVPAAAMRPRASSSELPYLKALRQAEAAGGSATPHFPPEDALLHGQALRPRSISTPAAYSDALLFESDASVAASAALSARVAVPRGSYYSEPTPELASIYASELLAADRDVALAGHAAPAAAYPPPPAIRGAGLSSLSTGPWGDASGPPAAAAAVAPPASPSSPHRVSPTHRTSPTHRNSPLRAMIPHELLQPPPDMAAAASLAEHEEPSDPYLTPPVSPSAPRGVRSGSNASAASTGGVAASDGGHPVTLLQPISPSRQAAMARPTSLWSIPEN